MKMPGFLEQDDTLPGIVFVDEPLSHTHGLKREVVELFDELRISIN